MKRTATCITYLLLMLLIGFTSCSKDGATGPEGPAGPAGPAGPGGPAGPAGANGAAGTANVIYSAWLDVTFTAVTNPDDITDTLAFQAAIPAPKLTNEILNSGDVKVYFNWGTSAQPDIDPLPYYNVFFNYTFTTSLTQGSIGLIASFDASTFTDAGSKYFQFRYVLIPGGTNARTSSAVDWTNYASVKAYLGLQD